MKEVAYSRAALKALDRMPAPTARTIRAKIAQYAADPASLANNVKALQNAEAGFRLRVGDWRVLFDEAGTVIAVIRIAPRGGVYG
jgi:mRNA interferase RelE/StbE